MMETRERTSAEPVSRRMHSPTTMGRIFLPSASRFSGMRRPLPMGLCRSAEEESTPKLPSAMRCMATVIAVSPSSNCAAAFANSKRHPDGPKAFPVAALEIVSLAAASEMSAPVGR